MKQFYIYIMTNQNNKVLYTGITNNLIKRTYDHKHKIDTASFTAKYNINKLVYYEIYEDSYSAISREKQIKGGSRNKKCELINKTNPKWIDLYDEIASLCSQ